VPAEVVAVESDCADAWTPHTMSIAAAANEWFMAARCLGAGLPQSGVCVDCLAPISRLAFAYTTLRNVPALTPQSSRVYPTRVRHSPRRVHPPGLNGLVRLNSRHRR
jgi:hypothetical protein